MITSRVRPVVLGSTMSLRQRAGERGGEEEEEEEEEEGDQCEVSGEKWGKELIIIARSGKRGLLIYPTGPQYSV